LVTNSKLTKSGSGFFQNVIIGAKSIDNATKIFDNFKITLAFISFFFLGIKLI